jgi:class 3 adenylate cyclase/TPR repeat protein
MERKLTTVLFSSVDGYREMLDLDEDRAINLVHEFKEIYTKRLEDFRGRVVSKVENEAIFEFLSPVSAAKFGILCQKTLNERNLGLPGEAPLMVRMAIHVGDVIFDGDALIGSAINLVSQLGRIADPGGAWVSGIVHHEIYNKVGDLAFTDLGEKALEQIRMPVRIYALELPGLRKTAARLGTAQEAHPPLNQAAAGASKSSAVPPPPTRASPQTSRELIALIMREREAATVSATSAHRILSSGNLDEACRIFLARVVRKKDFSSMVELLGMARSKSIPERLRRASGAVFECYSESLLSHKNMAIVGQLFADSFFGTEKREIAFPIWRIAARKDVEAMRLLGCALLDKPQPTEDETSEALLLLEQAARKKNGKASMRLGTFYANPLVIGQHKTEAFQWFWLARHLKEPAAQGELEIMAKTIRKDEFSSMKITADALIEEVEWSTRYNF